MDPGNFKSDPLDRKDSQDHVSKKFNRYMVQKVACYLDQVQQNGKKINIADSYIFEQRLNDAIQCPDKHKKTDHIDRQIGTFQFCNIWH